MNTLATQNKDILSVIADFIGYKDVCTLSGACKWLNRVMSSNMIWSNMYNFRFDVMVITPFSMHRNGIPEHECLFNVSDKKRDDDVHPKACRNKSHYHFLQPKLDGRRKYKDFKRAFATRVKTEVKQFMRSYQHMTVPYVDALMIEMDYTIKSKEAEIKRILAKKKTMKRARRCMEMGGVDGLFAQQLIKRKRDF